MRNAPQIMSSIIAKWWHTPLARGAGPAAIGVLFLSLLKWTWLAWPDACIDYGNQLYMAWQLSLGKVQQRDFYYPLGPLAQYVNGVWFRLWGPSLLAMVLLNLLILIGIIALLYRLMLEISNRFTAAAACLVFVAIFAFGQYVPLGNYNYVCPYASEATQGIALSLGALYLLMKFGRSGHSRWIAATGCCVGLILLTKPEVTIAIGVATTVGVSGTLAGHVTSARRWGRILGLFMGIILIPIALAVWLQSLVLPLPEALRASAGSWLFATTAGHSKMYLNWLGVDNIGENIQKMCGVLFLYAAVLIPTMLVAAYVRVRAKWVLLLAISLSCASAGGLLWLTGVGPWLAIGRPFPLFTLASLVWVFVKWRKEDQTDDSRARLCLAGSWVTFAGLMLGKMVLNVRLYHYGFFLAMPAALTLVVALLYWVPLWLAQRGVNSLIFKAVAVGLMLVCVIKYWQVESEYLGAKQYIVGHGADQFRADKRANFVNWAVDALGHTKPGTTVTPMPEGLMINYLARRENPFRPLFYTSFVTQLYGDATMTKLLERSAPDMIILTNAGEVDENGVGPFGADYGREAYAWIMGNYAQAAQVGAPLNKPSKYGMTVLARRNSPARDGP